MTSVSLVDVLAWALVILIAIGLMWLWWRAQKMQIRSRSVQVSIAILTLSFFYFLFCLRFPAILGSDYSTVRYGLVSLNFGLSILVSITSLFRHLLLWQIAITVVLLIFFLFF